MVRVVVEERQRNTDAEQTACTREGDLDFLALFAIFGGWTDRNEEMRGIQEEEKKENLHIMK